MTTYHTPVLLHEAVDGLHLQPGATVIDGTLGGGGHARALLERIMPGGHLIGFDRDQDAINHIQATLGTQYGLDQLTLIHDTYYSLNQHARSLSLTTVHAILLDLGISFHQIRDAGRGFSFQAVNEPLDMRMDVRQDLTATYLLNSYSERQLADIIHNYGEDPHARRIARNIVTQRQQQPLTIVQDLLNCVERAYRGSRKPKSHMATRTFQAIRIAVNDELDKLADVITDAISILTPGGYLAVITFHSLEDRIVKQTFKTAAQECICPPEFPECRCTHQATIQIVTKKPIIPSEQELINNPNARSAKLRIAKKINTNNSQS